MNMNMHRAATRFPMHGVKLDETGIYDGKVEPLCTNALRVER